MSVMLDVSTLTSTEQDVISIFLLSLGFFICFFSYKLNWLIFTFVGGILFGIFIWNEVALQFVDSKLICYVLGCALAFIGGIVAGFISYLLKWMSIGATFGSIFSLLIVLTDDGRIISNENRLIVLFSFMIISSILFSIKYDKTSELLNLTLFGGFLISLGVDILFDGSLILNSGIVFQLNWPHDKHCYNGCFMWQLLCLWISFSFIGFITQSHSSRLFNFLPMLNDCMGNHSPLIHTPNRENSLNKLSSQKTFTYPDNQAYNYFHPDSLPPALQAYSEVAYFTADQLANFFGFQDDNVKNQVEHILNLVANHKRFSDTDSSINVSESFYTKKRARMHHLRHEGRHSDIPSTSIHSLHNKIFQNYRQWCLHLEVLPIFTPNLGNFQGSGSFMDGTGNQDDEKLGQMTDVMLYMCIWGESANIRHMPECLCFLYHKMMQEFLIHSNAGDQTALYAGYFLDHVITPIWEVVVKSQKSKGDHVKIRNYDDFNEFFWDQSCLKYSYRDIENEMPSPPKGSMEHLDSLLMEQNIESKPSVSNILPVHKALSNAPKTFLEKRSFLCTILSFRRIVEFHTLTFYFLTLLAFSNYLVWELSYKLKILSSIFLVVNLHGIIWCLLEVWQCIPGIYISPIAKTGFVFRLCVRFLLLFYQTVYFIWSIDAFNYNRPGIEVQGSPVFWWWQYLWISCLAMSSYFVDVFLQLFPPVITLIFTRRSEYFNSFLNMSLPFSRLYVGKRVHENLWDSFLYTTFWVTLLAWKLYFSYKFEVKVLVLPSLELFDDFMNYENTSYWLTSILIALRWIPLTLIYFIDSSIWYSVWSGFVGSIIGFQEKLGEIKNLKSIKSYFMKMPEAFCQKILCENSAAKDPSYADLLMAGSSIHKSVKRGSIVSNAEDVNVIVSETTGLLAAARAEIGKIMPAQSSGRELLDDKTQKWAAFAAVWNEIINQMRLSDIISNSERDMLKFHTFPGFKKPVYFPIFQTAGCVELALNIVSEEASLLVMDDSKDFNVVLKREENMIARICEDVTVKEAVREVWELGWWFFQNLLGPTHKSDIDSLFEVFEHWASNKVLMQNIDSKHTMLAVKYVGDIVSILHSSLNGRHIHKNRETPKVLPKNGENGMKKSVSTGVLSSMVSDFNIGEQNGKKITSKLFKKNLDRRFNLAPRNDLLTVPDKARDEAREKLRPLLDSIRSMIKSNVGKGGVVLDKINFILSVEKGFMWDDYYATERLDMLSENPQALVLLSKLNGLLSIHVNEAEPSSKEAKRRLAFFANSLFMDIPQAPSLNSMLSWSCITPYYSEDVLYCKKDLKQPNEDGLSTLMYLKTLHKKEWFNFMERVGIQDEQLIWSKKYFQDLRLWASLRAQTLTRTVEGMMYNEAAIRLLSHIERCQPEQLESLIKQKFQYVVSCQVYGRMKKVQDPKADDIDRLLKRFPNLRVAYIDEVRERHNGNDEYFSVLIKASNNGESIEEVYRIKLPGNPIVGEGKPENQNHAIIFTRGENIQAIDMNQEGYFEEALKMRNLLQEFKPSSSSSVTIVGFREHIFTGGVSSLANYMALQESSFVTIGQRVLDKPLCSRLHYGHPDLFDKLFFVTRGGISKASKGINLSEDIFAGYNNSIRGGKVVFKEYAQVGKGRDIGMQQIYKFEAKLAQGAAEQTLSRDVNRLGIRLDFFRLISFYLGGAGYYVGNFITILSIAFVTNLMLTLAVFNLEKIGERKITPDGPVQMLLAGLGIMNTVPMLLTLIVEKGVFKALMMILQVFISGGPLYFMFHIQTRAHYFFQTLLVGGAKYRATGRGFVTHHSSLGDLYRFFASSHFYFGFELGAALIILGFTSEAAQYFGRTWSLWLACLSFLFCPFWFNPLSFEWGTVVRDYKKWFRWMLNSGGSSSNSWKVWWREENSYQLSFNIGQKLLSLIKPLFHIVIGIGIALPNLVSLQEMTSQDVVALIHVISVAIVLLLAYYFADRFGSNMYPWISRIGKLAISLVAFFGTISVVVSHCKNIRILIGLYYIFGSFNSIALLLGFTGMRFASHIHDFILGNVLFFVLFSLSALQFPKDIQTWLLYHNALSQGVVMEDILKYARKSQELSAGSQDGTDELEDLKKIIKQQEFMIEQLVAQASPGRISKISSMLENGRVDQTSGAGTFDEGVENEGIVPRAEMLRASSSTLDLSKMAGTATSAKRPNEKVGGKKADGNDFLDFRAPSEFPPRDS